MSKTAKQSGSSYRKQTDTGQVTIPAKLRGSEAGYKFDKRSDSQIILVPQDEIIVSTDFRQLSEKGQVTIPAEYRGEEDGYLVEQKSDGRLVLIPVKREIAFEQTND